MTRTTSADGRWVYTLYSPAKDVPFIHALDTTGRTAACIDLPMVSNDFDGVHLRLAAGTLVVTGPRGPEAFVDTHTFAVRRHRARPAPAHYAAAPHRGGGPPWVLILVAAPVLLAAVGLVARRRRRPAQAVAASPSASKSSA